MKKIIEHNIYMTNNSEFKPTAGQLFSSKYGSARGGKKMKGGTKRYGATQPLMNYLANKGMGRGYVGISNAKNVCQSGGGLDSSPFKGQGHRPIHVNPGYGYVNPNDNDVLRGNLPQVNSYDQNACVGGRKKRKSNKRKTNKRKKRKTNKRKTKKCICKKCKCSNKKTKKCNCKICKNKKCPCCKTMKRYSKKNIKKRNKKRRTKRNRNVKRKNMYGCGVKGGCSSCMLGGNKFNQATYAYTGKNVSPQFGTPLSVPNIDSKAYNHCFSAYKH
jgi:hypothetical protein